MSRLTGVIAALLTTLLTTLLTVLIAPPAQADRVVVPDEDSADAYPGDVDRVVIDHDRRTVRIRVHYVADAYDFTNGWFDTRGDAGPDLAFRLWRSEPELGRGIYRAREWGSHFAPGDSRRQCRGFRGRYVRPGDHEVVRLTVPRRCLRVRGEGPRRLRLSVATGTDTAGPPSDWVPGRREWSRRVPRA